MKRSLSGILIGFIFIALALAIVLKAFGYDIDIFFDGWWTLFIIIPSFFELFNRYNRTSAIIGLGVGTLLLLTAQDIIEWQMFGKLIIALIFLMIGLSMIFKKNYKPHHFNTEHATGAGNKNYAAYFGGRDIRYDNQEFTGATISVAFGGIELNLKNAIITSDAVIEASVAFGGIDITVPNNVRVEIDCTPILGGVENKAVPPSSIDGSPIPTLYINSTCILGGIDVK